MPLRNAESRASDEKGRQGAKRDLVIKDVKHIAEVVGASRSRSVDDIFFQTGIV